MNKIGVAMAAFAMMSATLGFGDATALQELYKQARRGGSYSVQAKAEINRSAELFSRMLGPEPSSSLPDEWKKLGFDMSFFREGPRQFAVLAEDALRKEGRGFFVFTPGSESKIVLELPHSFKDVHTGDIGFSLALTGRFRAIAWNSVPRYYKKDGVRIDTDLAHISESHFNAFTRAVARSLKDIVVLQLHGFEQGKRRTPKAAGAEIIVSSGSRKPSQKAERITACLRDRTGLSVLLYGSDIRELGGTTNAQSAVMAEEGNNGFVHLEMSMRTREKALNDSSFREILIGCFEKGIK